MSVSVCICAHARVSHFKELSVKYGTGEVICSCYAADPFATGSKAEHGSHRATWRREGGPSPASPGGVEMPKAQCGWRAGGTKPWGIPACRGALPKENTVGLRLPLFYILAGINGTRDVTAFSLPSDLRPSS